MLSLIAAVSENGVIGKDGGLPWRLPDDLRWFMRTTLGHACIMGRGNADTLDKPLRDRRNLVLTRQPDWSREGFEVYHGLDAALATVADDDEPFIIGGEQVYRLALPKVDRMYLTRVHAAVDGDTRFPAVDEADWSVTDLDHHPADDRHAFAFTIRRYDRR